MSNEQIYFDALKRITKYDSVDRLRRNSEKRYGLDFAEALEYAYENVIGEAERAVRGRRRPKGPAQPAMGRTPNPTLDKGASE